MSFHRNWRESCTDKDGNVVAADHTTREYAEQGWLTRRIAKRDGRGKAKIAVKGKGKK